jgi:hypothetical protein
MVSIAEQARQNPMNATPIGRDPVEVKYPAVNTCATVTVCCLSNLIGLHLGLFMGAGEEGGKGSESSEMIDLARLDLFLHVLRQHVRVYGGGEPRKIYVAGALAVWQTVGPQWPYLKSELAKLLPNKPHELRYVQFDDSVVTTVDIYVTFGGVQFTQVGQRGSIVQADPSFIP